MGVPYEKTLSTRVKIVKRSTGGNAIRSAAYRAGQDLTDARTGEVFAYARRKGVEASFILAPEGAQDWVFDRTALWNKVVLSEKRKDAQEARDVYFSLPYDLSPERREATARHVAENEFVRKGMVADVAVHLFGQSWDAGTEKGEEKIALWKNAGYAFLGEAEAMEAAKQPRSDPFVMVTYRRDGSPKDYRLYQPHVHCLMPLRPLSADGLGFGQKIGVRDDWNEQSTFDAVRGRIAEHQTRELADAGCGLRVDHRSYEERRVDALGRAETARSRGDKMAARQLEDRAFFFAKVAQPYMGMAFRLKALTGKMRDRFGQWVAAHTANQVGPSIERLEGQDTTGLVAYLERLIDAASDVLGLRHGPEPDASYER